MLIQLICVVGSILYKVGKMRLRSPSKYGSID